MGTAPSSTMICTRKDILDRFNMVRPGSAWKVVVREIRANCFYHEIGNFMVSVIVGNRILSEYNF